MLRVNRKTIEGGIKIFDQAGNLIPAKSQRVTLPQGTYYAIRETPEHVYVDRITVNENGSITSFELLRAAKVERNAIERGIGRAIIDKMRAHHIPPQVIDRWQEIAGV